MVELWLPVTGKITNYVEGGGGPWMNTKISIPDLQLVEFEEEEKSKEGNGEFPFQYSCDNY